MDSEFGGGIAGARPRVPRTTQVLPFLGLSPADFERLCLALVGREGYERVEHVGLTGRDDGCDLVAFRQGRRVVFQCKRHKELYPKEVEAVVKKVLALPLEERPEELVLIATCPVTLPARRRARALAGSIEFQVWALTELDSLVNSYPDLVAQFFDLSPRWTWRQDAGTEEEVRRRSRSGYARAALLCGRDHQWKAIGVHALLECHEALFIQGARVEAPDLFLEAVERCFPESPARRIVPVPWTGSLPRTQGQFREELAAALDCAELDLERTLRDWLWDRNLVLVHKPVLQEALEEEPLRDYYRGLLPQLLPGSGETRGFAKVIQGVAWTPSYTISSWLAWLASRLWRRPAAWIERALERSRAEDVLKHLENLSAPLPLIVLPPLQPITSEDVEHWSWSLELGQDRAAAVRDVLRGARSSVEILARAAKYSIYAGSREEAP